MSRAGPVSRAGPLCRDLGMSVTGRVNMEGGSPGYQGHPPSQAKT